MNIEFSNIRAAKARLAVLLEARAIQLFLKLGAIGGIVGGLVVVLLQGSSLGWLLGALGIACTLPALWYDGELQNLPAGKGQTPTDLLHGAVLGKLKASPDTADIVEAALKTPAGRFFAVRFSLHPEELFSRLTNQPAELEATWQFALQARAQYNLPVVNAACLVAGVVQALPSTQEYLASLRLDEKDILAGVGWQQHIEHLIETHRERPLYGGVARDWAFGFTPLLERFAYNVTENVQRGLLARNIEGHQEVIAQTMQVLSQSARHNAVLVGGVGAGKSTIVHMLAEQLINPKGNEPRELKYSQVIGLDPAMLISHAGGRGELENLVSQLFVEAIRAKNIILFLDDAQLFLQDGTGAVNLANVLLPILEGGGLRVIMSMDETQWVQLSQSNPALLQLLNRVPVNPLSQEETMRVMEDQLLVLEYQSKTTFLYHALLEAYNLSSRYIGDQVMPGRALKLLESATRFAEQGFVTAHSVQRAVEQTYGVKVSTADTAEDRDKLLNLEQLIHQRMINQTRAVQVVSDALRRARSGVRNQSRPIGTFLFLGPTGVGKTELAKSLASVYFGGEDRLVRIDLNEYVRSEDLVRLIATSATDAHSLAAQIARQPFSVVLLDEIEKAHPDILSALLQLLDEGILRDSTNREVSFRDAIIIATSNAGAQQIRAHIDKGEEVQQFEEEFTNELINSNTFRPEFLNRFDEIVIFRPLTQTELLQVVDIIIAGINKTLGAQKISIALTDAAKQALVQEGYDPRLGARPLRRVVQRRVENVIAQRMLTGQIAPGKQIVLDITDIGMGAPTAQ